jgi:hypothetical protein
MIKDPSKPLEPNEIEELLKEFEKWLKSEKKMSNYPNASYDRDKRKKRLEELLIKPEVKPPTLRRIAETIEIEITKDRQSDVLQDIVDFFKNELGIEIGSLISRSQEEEIKDVSKVGQDISTVEVKRVIGRVAPTINTPATPTEFTFWTEDDENIHVEIGSLVTARGENGVRVTGLVSEIHALTDIKNVLDSYYAHAFGKPSEEMPTRLPMVMSAKVEVVRRSDGRTEAG